MIETYSSEWHTSQAEGFAATKMLQAVSSAVPVLLACGVYPMFLCYPAPCESSCTHMFELSQLVPRCPLHIQAQCCGGNECILQHLRVYARHGSGT